MNEPIERPSMPPAMPRLITPDEAADHLRVSRRTLRRLPIVKVVLGHRTVRYRLPDLEAYEKRAEAA